MSQPSSNIVLIGMPGAGKSTLGPLLAKESGRAFVDTDTLIEETHGRTLQDIINKDGLDALRRVEEEALLSLDLHNHVIATGGSAVYSAAGMAHLKSRSVVVFLEVELSTLEARIPNFTTRGLVKRPDQSFADLFAERDTLYKHYADITLKCDFITAAEASAHIIAAIQ